jgi:hypothetical protein
MEKDIAVDVQAETDPDETMADDDLLAVAEKGQGITDGTSNT